MQQSIRPAGLLSKFNVYVYVDQFNYTLLHHYSKSQTLSKIYVVVLNISSYKHLVK